MSDSTSTPESADLDLNEGDPTSTPAADPALHSSESEEANTKPFSDDQNIIPVIGFGGSAGSIGPLQEFFSLIAPDTGLAFVVVMHLSPDYESQLPSILGARTTMPVVQVSEPVRIEPNHVYVIPPAKHLAMQDGRIELTELDRPRGRHVAVDLFFRTLSATHRSRAVAVVLSGTDSDGAVGIKRVKEHGGVTVAQDPDECEHDGMPRAAIATGMVDWVLPARDMAAKLEEFARNEERIRLPAARAGETIRAVAESPDEAALREILAVLAARTDHDFSHYKRATVLRRIGRRLQVNALTNLPDYVAFLRTHPGEVGALLQDLLISVTNFFRDPESFEALQFQVSQLFGDRRAGETVRVWVPGCATGEEAYSVAMLLFEHADKLAAPPDIQVFATDIDEEALRVARLATYPSAIAADVSPERLRRFFAHDGGRYRVKKEVREAVLFASHNVLRDAPFSRLDLVSCRNLLIYFTADAQERVFELFHFALREEGLLFLGSAEIADDSGALFAPLDKKHHLFRRRSAARPVLPSLPVNEGKSALVRYGARPLAPVPLEAAATSDSAPVPMARAGLPGDLHLRLLEEIAPPSILVNNAYEIVHLSEHAGRFLRVTAGEPSHNLLDLAPPELRLELRAALFRAFSQGNASDVAAIEVALDSGRQSLGAQVRAVHNGAETWALVLLQPENAAAAPPPRDDQSLASRLEDELRALRAQTRETVEQYETAAEELKASNEELQALNEELQAASEELETSREELQATNEELTTVNQEMRAKIEEVSRANSDLRNLMASTDIATVFLDRELRIARYTPRATDLFRLLPSDMGRPLTDLRHGVQLEEVELDALCDRVLETLVPVEREVQSVTERDYVLRVLPYRTQDERIDGVVLTFVDITERKRAEEALRASEEKYRTLFDSIDQGFCIVEMLFDAEGQARDYRFLEANPAFLQQTGLEGAVGRTMRELAPDHEEFWFETYGHIARSGEAQHFENEAAALHRFYDVYAFRAGEPEQNRVAILFHDISQRKAIEAARRESETRLYALIENLPNAAAFVFDRDLRYVLAAGTALSALNQDGAQFVGRTLREAVPRAQFEISEPLLRGALAGQAFEVEHAVGERTFSTRGVPLQNADDEIYGVLAVSYDVTPLKEAEAVLQRSHDALEVTAQQGARDLFDRSAQLQRSEIQFERAFHHSPMALSLTTWKEGRIIDINAAGAEFFGRARAEMIGQNADWSSESLQVVRGPRTRAAFLTLMRKKGLVRDMDIRLRRPDGSVRDAIVNAVTLEPTEAGGAALLLSMFMDVTERRAAEAAREGLMQRLVSSQEDERRRISRELHDELGQSLTVLIMGLNALPSFEGDVAEAANARVEGLRRVAEELADSAHRMAWELRPAALDTLGLEAALRDYIGDWSQNTGITADFESSLQGERLGSELESTFYRVTQEALTNVARHSSASRAQIALEHNDSHIFLLVEDDGQGFDADDATQNSKRLGLLGMRERIELIGGVFTIDSTPGQGTTIYARVPAPPVE